MYVPKGKVLEVGFGIGLILFGMYRTGYEVYGVDIDKKAYDFVIKNSKSLIMMLM